MKSRSVASSECALLIVLLVVLGCANSNRRDSQPKSLTTQHRAAISNALGSRGYPSPSSLEITDGGFLVATFELHDLPSGGFRAFGEESILIIREAVLRYHLVQAYRVTLNGPSPGTGLIRRYGNVRFIEGGQVEWEPAR